MLPNDDQLMQELEVPFTVTGEQLDFYKENGYIKLKNVLSPMLLQEYGAVIHGQVAELSRDALPIEQRDTYGKAFLQIMNLWTESPRVKEFVFGKRMASIAAQLIGATGVRIYHDQALYKEAGGGITPWHADQYYWPVDSDRTITAWVPLQTTPHEMGPLIFSEGSHRLQVGRDLEISDESEITLQHALEDFPVDDSAYELGDISFHAGWTYHRAGANTTNTPREVMTVIYMDEHIRVTAPKNKNHVADMGRWMPGLEAGDLLISPLNPVLYSTNTTSVSVPDLA